MTKVDVIIIGAGASGLSAARELSRKGKKVMIVEARDRIGGRIYSMKGEGFDVRIEGGAEFVHGNLPLTLQLLQEYGIVYHHVEGEIWNFRRGKYTKGYDVIQHQELLEEKLSGIKEDISIEEFISSHFSGPQYVEMVDAIRGYIEGYDAADTARASTLAFKEEWQQEQPWEQYHLNGGYGMLMHALWQDCHAHGVKLFLSEVVKEIHWSASHVQVITDVKTSYEADQVLITIPLGVWQAPAGAEASIAFFPPLPKKTEAAYALGFGHVVKFVLEFKEAFWKNKSVQQATGVDLHKLFFLFSDEVVPTWWTQEPSPSPVLTGWLAGPAAFRYIGDEQQMTQDALSSLSEIFKISIEQLKSELLAIKVFNWTNDPYALGAYSYSTLEAEKFMQQFMKPVGQRLFFAGEALDRGHGTGTVEAALGSGLEAAKEMINSGQ
ncbi:MAG: FAD-dependent oxidoreductase [Cytophagaceae bacterium]|nr:FAD-dependent oxidoreductase [Cytophagaceae bacterium]